MADHQYSQDSDHQVILVGLQEGHPTAIGIVENWLRRAVRAPQFRIPADEVDDLVQEGLAQILRMIAAPDFEVHTSLKALVRRVGMARSVDWIRRRKMVVELSDQLAAEHVDPLDRIARQEDLGRIHEAVSQLKDLCRQLIRMHFVQEMTYQAIAEQTGRNASTLRVHMFNCLDSLRRALGV